jgi:hypothetical protein
MVFGMHRDIELMRVGLEGADGERIGEIRGGYQVDSE